jgi:hypothetical protein
MTCPEARSIGAYVLGALDAGEHQQIEQHIRDCASCAEAVLQFAHLPGVLNKLTLEDVLALPFDAELVPEGGRRIRRWPVTPRRMVLAAAALVLIVAGGLIGRQLAGDPTYGSPQAQSGVTWSATNGVGGIDAQVRLSSRDWGTNLEVRLADLQPGQRCTLVVHTRSGQSETTGWWTTTTSVREADVPASSSFAIADITRIDIVNSDNKVITSVSDATR